MWCLCGTLSWTYMRQSFSLTTSSFVIVCVIYMAAGSPQCFRMNPVRFLAAWTLLTLLLCWIWLLHLSMAVCQCGSLMKTTTESWRGDQREAKCSQSRVSFSLSFSQLTTSTDWGWSLANRRLVSQDKQQSKNVTKDSRKPPNVSPCRPHAMFTVITSVTQRSKSVIKPTTRW